MNDQNVVVNDEEVQKRNAEFVRIRLQAIAEDMIASVSLTDFQEMVSSLQNKPKLAKNLFEIQSREELLCDIKDDINQMYLETNLEEKFAALNDLLIMSTKLNKRQLEEPIDTCESQLSETRAQILFERKQELEKIVKEQQAFLIKEKTKILLQRAKLEPLMTQVKTTMKFQKK